MCWYFCIGFIDFMLKGKTLTEFTNLSLPNKKWWYNFKLFYEQYLNMDGFNKTQNIYPNLATNLSNKQQFRLNKINEIKDYFLAQIRERELISKSLSKYIVSLDYFEKALNALSLLSGSIPIASFASVIGAPAGIIGENCGFKFLIISGFVKRFLKTITNNKKKNTIKWLC